MRSALLGFASFGSKAPLDQSGPAQPVPLPVSVP